MNDVRSTYRELSEAEKAVLGQVKIAAQTYIDVLKALPPSRETSLAVTNAEQSVMWAVKGLTA